MKKKLLIVAHHLTIGGVQKSLISALKVIDYEKYDVTLYLRKNRTDLLSFVDNRVNVLINDDKNHYYRKPFSLILQILIAVLAFFGNKENVEKLNKKLTSYIVKCQMKYERNRFFSSQKYDIAISYLEGYTMLFVAEYIDAARKFCFFRSSTDDYHEVQVSIINKFEKILTLHNNHKVMVAGWYPVIAERVYVVENYTDKDFIIGQSREYSVEKDKNKIVLCSCGRLAKVKGFDLAVEAANVLKRKNISFTWFFVGDGPERASVEKIIEKYQLQKEIRITGMQKNPYPYIDACDIYVQPSYEESYGNTMVEAQILLKPIVTTETLGGKKLVQTGLNGIVSSITPEGLAQGIEQFITDNDLYNFVKDNLASRDYSNEYLAYKDRWQNLLER